MSRRCQTPPFSTFADFWEHYVGEHEHPVNQALHVIGTIGGFICVAMAIRASWWWAVAVLPVGYGTAWLGHVLIEHNRPATLKYPLWSLFADYRMVFRLLLCRRLQPNPTAQLAKEQSST